MTPAALSPRQRQILALIADGLTNAEIAAQLHVSLATASRHVYDIRVKLGARNRAHCVALGYRAGLPPRGRTYEEWRVTGNPGDEYGPYRFTWTPMQGPGAEGDPEGKARAFLALVKANGRPWVDGPHLHHRTVTVTDWEPA